MGNYQNQQNRQPVNSTELTQNSDPLNTTLPQIPNINTPLPSLYITSVWQVIRG